MSLEELADNLGETTSRKRFLRKIGAATLGVTVGAMGLSSRAYATDCPTTGYQCCNLCKSPSGSCSNCSCGTWCWECCGNCLTGEKWRCCECYRTPECNCCSACSWAYIYDYSCQKCQGPS
jgi:hypothetical protein